MFESTAAYGWNPDMPMPLQEKLKEDLKLALRSRQDVLKNAIRQVMSEFFKLTVPVVLEGGKKSTRPKKSEEITNDDIIGIIQGLIKSAMRKEEGKSGTRMSRSATLSSCSRRRSSRSSPDRIT